MNQESTNITLRALFVDDDEEIIQQCQELMPKQIQDHEVLWEFASSFEDAIGLLSQEKYDVVVTDVYKGRNLTGKSNVSDADNHAKAIVDSVKRLGFSFVVLYSDGPKPEGMFESPSIRFVDKSAAKPEFPESVTEVLAELIKARGSSLEILRKLRAELDRAAGSYVWEFIDDHWDQLNQDPAFLASGLERLIRRRAVTQLNEEVQAQGLARRTAADRYDYYIYPPLQGSMRLGTLVRRKSDQAFFVVLTPHCHLVSQGKDGEGRDKPPRADLILLSQCLDARDVIGSFKSVNKSGSLRIPATGGVPDGRICFLPGFAEIPDMFADLMRLSSVPYDSIGREFDSIAVLDSPFAEAIQSSLSRFYANVGHRNLSEQDFPKVFEEPAAAAVAQVD